MGRSFPAFLSRITNEDEADIKISSSAETRSRRNCEGKEVAKYVKQHQALDREGRVAWRDLQQLYAEEKRGQMRSGWRRYKQKRKGGLKRDPDGGDTGRSRREKEGR